MGDNTIETPLEPYKFLKITRNPDGSLTRSTYFPISPPTGEDTQDQQVLSKDVSLNPAHKTWLRIFRPANPPGSGKLPIIVDYHGGGFILFSAATALSHDSCVRLAEDLPALVVSVDYRLAPESRLPAAYDDAVEAILWVRAQAIDKVGDAWLRNYADFSSCFLMGGSAGGNIVYHAALRAMTLDLEPLKVAGLVFNQPFFGGVQRTGSELRLIDDQMLPLMAGDLMWELALPSGADRDHEYSNPMGSDADQGAIGLLPRCLVRGYGGDPLLDRQREFVKMLEGHGVTVVDRFVEDGYHGADFFDPLKSQALLKDVKDFVYISTA
eukprot:TRINITY_DN1805_c0_g2_i1.p1 TRINITY_DN1805_c0_g2~~TRINITY_DN1805_c0_g2_i1.p1  ORF type:complete len:325 (+),score=31.00 TRINITY_DN1805_c0_g2_i1:628-1602(+)